MSELEVRELRYFIAVAEELNFSRAAERLGIAQPPLSKAIAQVESRLGVRLLERTTRQVRLTCPGQVLLEHARIAVDAVHAAARRVRRADQAARRLVIAVTPGDDAGLLRGILTEYQRAACCLLSAEVVVGDSYEPVAMLRDGRADVALRRGPFAVPGFDAVALVAEPRIAVLPAEHPLAARDRLQLADFAGEMISRWPADASPGADGATQHHSGLPIGLPGPVVPSIEQLLENIAHGRTLAFLAQSITRRHRHPDLVYRTVAGLPRSTVMVVWPESSRSKSVAEFVRAAETVAARHADNVIPDGQARHEQ